MSGLFARPLGNSVNLLSVDHIDSAVASPAVVLQVFLDALLETCKFVFGEVVADQVEMCSP